VKEVLHIDAEIMSPS